MNTRNLVSIVVPVYNVAPYLEQCMESLINQTYKKLEIICVDDGSTDESGRICDRYAEADSRVKVVHRVNGGLATARNTGIPEVTGEYVYFMDSDDYLDLDAIEVMHRLISENGCDILFAGFYRNDDPNRPDETGDFSIVNRKEALRMCLTDGEGGVVYPSACGKLLRVDTVKEQLYFRAEFLVSEDYEFSVRTLLTTQRLGQLDRALYHYRFREDSLINKATHKTLHLIDAHGAVISMLEKSEPELVPLARKRLGKSCMFALYNAIRGGNTDRTILEPLVKALRENKKLLLADSAIPAKRKLLIRAMCEGTASCRIMAWLCGLKTK